MLRPTVKPIAPYILIPLLLKLMFTFAIPVAYADTDGSELQSTPDILVLQLGADWAGAEFELKFDFGVFPMPVKAHEQGTLTMNLGGSKTYTLRLLSGIAETPAAVQPPPSDPPIPAQSEPPSTPPPVTPQSDDGPDESGGGIPALHLTLFIGGLLIGIGGLAAFYIIKRRRRYDDEDEYSDDDNAGWEVGNGGFGSADNPPD
jgi:hypothetical protein